MPSVTLVDGRTVDVSSEEGKHEAEARAILALTPLAQRRAWLEDIERKRGKAAAERLKDTMKALWKAST